MNINVHRGITENIFLTLFYVYSIIYSMYERGNVFQVCVSQADCVVLLWPEYATISFRPAQDHGNTAVPPGIPDWNCRAETNTAGGALPRLH